MNILVSGSTGLIGSALMPFLKENGHTVTPLIRSQEPTTSRGAIWNPPSSGPVPDALAGIDAVVHLAGESIAKRWTAHQKAVILNSRVIGTQLLTAAILKMKTPPKVYIGASAIGYYGNRGAEPVREDSAPGQGFLADVCRQWEDAARPLAERGIRTVWTRFGIVLDPRGGALGKMLLPFKLGLGGRIGDGTQYMSWVSIRDIVGLIAFVLTTEHIRGPANAVAPRAVTNLEFTKTLGKVLQRPTIFPIPAFAARWAFGEMADEMLLAGVRVEPRKFAAAGYRFQAPDLETALRQLLDNSRA